MATNSLKPAGSLPGNPDDTSAAMDADPYVCSLLETVGRPYQEERRQKPRGKIPLGRRASLIVQGKRKQP